jgi:hypothetical protein
MSAGLILLPMTIVSGPMARAVSRRNIPRTLTLTAASPCSGSAVLGLYQKAKLAIWNLES